MKMLVRETGFLCPLRSVILLLFALSSLPSQAGVIYQNTFDTDPEWICDPGWAFGTPTGGGGQYGSPDPASGHTGLNVFGYNLSGDYENNISTTRYLTMPAVDCSHWTNVRLTFWRWLGTEQPVYDHASIEISNNGSSWTSVWSNSAEIADSAWTQADYDISSVADGETTIYVRWGLGPTNAVGQYCGWNIDDLALSGDPVPPFGEAYRFERLWPQIPQPWYFSKPEGITVASDDNLYIVDKYRNNVQKFDSSGRFLTKWGSRGTGDGQFLEPYDVTADSAGNVYVTEGDYLLAPSGNHRVQKFDSTGTFLTKWGSYGTGDGQFDHPQGVAADGAGNVYVADTGNSRIQKFDPSGVFLTKWGSLGSGDGQFDNPSSVAVDSADNVYVADRDNHRVQKFNSNGMFVTKWGSLGTGEGQLDTPSGVAVDGVGNVYVTEGDYENYPLGDNHRVQKFDSFGTPSCRLGD